MWYIRISMPRLEPIRRPNGTKRAIKKTLILNSNPGEVTLGRFDTRAKNLERRIGSSLDTEIQMHNNIVDPPNSSILWVILLLLIYASDDPKNQAGGGDKMGHKAEREVTEKGAVWNLRKEKGAEKEGGDGCIFRIGSR